METVAPMTFSSPSTGLYDESMALSLRKYFACAITACGACDGIPPPTLFPASGRVTPTMSWIEQSQDSKAARGQQRNQVKLIEPLSRATTRELTMRMIWMSRGSAVVCLLKPARAD